eukprot:g16598.t1
MARVGTPLSSVEPGADLEQELGYGNHSSVDEFKAEVWEKVVADVAAGKALVFPKRMARDIPGLRASPMGVVKEKGGKIRHIHDLTIEVGKGGSVNSTTKFEEVPGLELGQIMPIVTRAQRAAVGRTAHSQRSTARTSRTAAALIDRRSGSPRPSRGRGRGAGRGGRSPRAASTPYTSADIAALIARMDAMQEEIDNREGAVQQLQRQLDDAIAQGAGPGAPDPGAGGDGGDGGDGDEPDVVVTNTTPPSPEAALGSLQATRAPTAQVRLVCDKEEVKLWRNSTFSKKWVLTAHRPPEGTMSLTDMRTSLRGVAAVSSAVRDMLNSLGSFDIMEIAAPGDDPTDPHTPLTERLEILIDAIITITSKGVAGDHQPPPRASAPRGGGGRSGGTTPSGKVGYCYAWATAGGCSRDERDCKFEHAHDPAKKNTRGGGKRNGNRSRGDNNRAGGTPADGSGGDGGGDGGSSHKGCGPRVGVVEAAVWRQDEGKDSRLCSSSRGSSSGFLGSLEYGWAYGVMRGSAAFARSRFSHKPPGPPGPEPACDTPGVMLRLGAEEKIRQEVVGLAHRCSSIGFSFRPPYLLGLFRERRCTHIGQAPAPAPSTSSGPRRGGAGRPAGSRNQPWHQTPGRNDRTQANEQAVRNTQRITSFFQQPASSSAPSASESPTGGVGGGGSSGGGSARSNNEPQQNSTSSSGSGSGGGGGSGSGSGGGGGSGSGSGGGGGSSGGSGSSPSCHPQSAFIEQPDGWNTEPRRVFLDDDVCYLIGFRYECKKFTNENKEKDEDERTTQTFDAWDPAVLARMDDFVSQEFPFVLTKKAAISKSIVDRLADDLLEGKGFAANDGGSWAREEYLQLRGQLIDGRLLAGDASFKYAKVVRLSTGADGTRARPVYGIFTIMNEYDQVVFSKAMSTGSVHDLENDLKMMFVKRFLGHGFKLPVIFYSDECCEDRQMLLTIFKEIESENHARLYDAAEEGAIEVFPQLTFPDGKRGQLVFDLRPDIIALPIGVNVNLDATNLERDYGVQVANTVDLRTFARQGWVESPCRSLAEDVDTEDGDEDDRDGHDCGDVGTSGGDCQGARGEGGGSGAGSGGDIDMDFWVERALQGQGMTPEAVAEYKDRNWTYFLRNCRRLVPEPNRLLERFNSVIDMFGNVVDAKSGEVLLRPDAMKAVKLLRKHIEGGCLSDPEGVPLYYTTGQNAAGITTRRCVRGTNCTEVTVCVRLLSSYCASPALAHSVLLEFNFRWNVRMAVKNRGLSREVGEFFDQYEIEKIQRDTAIWYSNDPLFPEWVSALDVADTGLANGFRPDGRGGFERQPGDGGSGLEVRRMTPGPSPSSQQQWSRGGGASEQQDYGSPHPQQGHWPSQQQQFDRSDGCGYPHANVVCAACTGYDADPAVAPLSLMATSGRTLPDTGPAAIPYGDDCGEDEFVEPSGGGVERSSPAADKRRVAFKDGPAGDGRLALYHCDGAGGEWNAEVENQNWERDASKVNSAAADSMPFGATGGDYGEIFHPGFRALQCMPPVVNVEGTSGVTDVSGGKTELGQGEDDSGERISATLPPPLAATSSAPTGASFAPVTTDTAISVLWELGGYFTAWSRGAVSRPGG